MTGTMDAPSAPGPTRKLAAYVAGLRFEALPPAVVEAAKTFTLDLLGTALGAVHTAEAKIAVKIVGGLGGRKECSLIGFPLQSSCRNAAFINSLVAHVLELDDIHRESFTHVGAPVIPAALAMAERERADGRTLLTAIVAGYEATLRIANAVQPSHYRTGFLSMGTCGGFGAAAAAGHCLGLDAGALANAFGLAGIQAAGINASMYRHGDMGKRLTPAQAAERGVLAALFAREGFTGPDNIVEGKFGFGEIFSRACALERVTAGLGERFEILRTSLKPYSCGRFNHAPIDALFAIMRDQGVAAGDIAAIAVRTHEIAVFNRPHRAVPSSVFDAKMSMPFSLAVAACRGGAGEADFTEETIRDSRLHALAAKVRIEADAEMSRAFPAELPASVRVETSDGRRFERRVAFPKGEPEMPMTPDEVREKFLGLATRALPRARALAVAETVAKLDTMATLTPLLDLLRVRARRSR